MAVCSRVMLLESIKWRTQLNIRWQREIHEMIFFLLSAIMDHEMYFFCVNVKWNVNATDSYIISQGTLSNLC